MHILTHVIDLDLLCPTPLHVKVLCQGRLLGDNAINRRLQIRRKKASTDVYRSEEKKQNQSGPNRPKVSVAPVSVDGGSASLIALPNGVLKASAPS